RASSTTEGPATFQAYTHPLCKIRSASEKRDGYTVATLALLAGAQLLDRLVGLEVAADRRAQRAGAVAVHDEDRVAPGHQALVDEPVDLGDRIVDAVAAHVERGVERARVGAAARRHPLDELDL